ncbi:hypothetical protein [Nonomuraea sediminis]|uniref:hypothetical protein n=1 Tax=Nonomuraea sediminis TaxID=2835864 RepID=UPI001BDC4722|nr:hypothetical protein [Nonomuraea sediminis]
MRKSVTTVAVAASLAVGGFIASPAQAIAARYTPEGVCGSGYGRVTHDGSRPVQYRGATYGRVYLLYNRAKQSNCVVTLKTRYTGSKTTTGAALIVQPKPIKDTKQDPIKRIDAGNYQYYAGPVREYAPRCVKYWGTIESPDGKAAYGGRTNWDNCSTPS